MVYCDYMFVHKTAIGVGGLDRRTIAITHNGLRPGSGRRFLNHLCLSKA